MRHDASVRLAAGDGGVERDGVARARLLAKLEVASLRLQNRAVRRATVVDEDALVADLDAHEAARVGDRRRFDDLGGDARRRFGTVGGGLNVAGGERQSRGGDHGGRNELQHGQFLLFCRLTYHI